ncbi:MAG: hypothetical protein K2I81_02000 [Alphaproteobacteria bacterium]|nr:hypothetical protein [Alphaproteobacteria bacterium]
MNGHTDGFYEIEFQRAYKQQSEVLRDIGFRQKQLTCYVNKREELREWGGDLKRIEARIKLTNRRLAAYNDLHEQIEDYKEEISINNPRNAERARDAKIIADAYERAYAPAAALPPIALFSKLCKFIAMRQK